MITGGIRKGPRTPPLPAIAAWGTDDPDDSGGVQRVAKPAAGLEEGVNSSGGFRKGKWLGVRATFPAYRPPDPLSLRILSKAPLPKSIE